MESDDRSRLDYEQTVNYYHTLQDVRFKLLGFLSLVSGAAITVVPKHVESAQQIALAFLGGLITLGLTSYDQRNTHILERLLCRARFLEKQLGFRLLPPSASDDLHQKGRWAKLRSYMYRRRYAANESNSTQFPGGGPFHARPPLQTVCGVWLAWHIQGLTIVYASCLTAWAFIGISATGVDQWVIAKCTAIVFIATYCVLRCLGSFLYEETRNIRAAVDSLPSTAKPGEESG